MSLGSDDGLAVNVLLALFAAPVMNVTFATLEKPANVAVTTTVSAVVLLRVTEHCPLVAVEQVVALRVMPVLGTPANVTACPVTGLLVASFTVMSSVLAATPSSANDVGLGASTLVVPAAGPATKVTTAVLSTPAKFALTVTG